MAAKQKYTSAQIMHFLIPSLIGAIVFLLPIPMKGSLNTILGIAIDWGKAILKPWLPGTAMVLVVLSALASLWATLCKPEKIAKDSFWGELLIVRPFWLASRLLGAALYIVIFFKLVLPLSVPILATVGLMIGIAYWNDWQNALYYIDDKSLYTVQAVLNAINESVAMLASLGGTAGASAADLPSTTIRMAVAVVGIFPVLVAYPFFQKYFAAGLMAGSVKG